MAGQSGSETAGAPLNVELQTGAPLFPWAQDDVNELYRLSLEVAADEVVWLRPDASIIFVNQSTCTKLGYADKSDLIGKRVWDWDPLFPQEVWPTFWAQMRECRSAVFETQHKSLSGEIFPVEVQAHLVDHKGEEVLLAFGTDISDRVARKEELEALVQARTEELERFVYRTSHDLKAPLIGARHLARFMVEDARAGRTEDVIKTANRVDRLMVQLSHLVDDMLSLVKADLEVGQKEPVDLEAMITQVCDYSASLHTQEGVQCRFDISAAGGESVIIERVRLQQVLQNLVSNAVKYRDPDKAHACVQIQAEVKSGDLRLSVADNGRGIEPGDLPRVFERFTRFHRGQIDGSGLGLAIVKQHIDHLGGCVEAASEGPGQGSTFTVSIPLEAP